MELGLVTPATFVDRVGANAGQVLDHVHISALE